jgi:nicotinamide mononucleotide adenylyltransferase
MKTFKEILETAYVDLGDLSEAISVSDGSHYTHIEDELFSQGSKAIPKIMVSLVDTIKGIPTTDAQTKIDGSPSVMYGYEKGTGKFFVATKSIFNKDPKINYTNADIDRNHGHAPGLVVKLKLALKYLPTITGTKGIYLQGDVMFDPADLETRDIDGISHYIFQPNTVVNAVPVESKLGKQISNAKFGFAPHTKYSTTGSRQSISPADIKHSSTVFVMPIHVPKLSDYSELQPAINVMRKELESTNKAGLDFVSSADIKPLMMAFVNYAVKERATVSYPLLVTYVTQKFDKEIASVKTDKSKEAKKANRDSLIEKLSQNKAGIESVLSTHRHVSEFKDKMIKILDSQQPIRRFFKGEMGALHPTSPEGYVAINKHGTSKFVNRSVFSLQNFIQNGKKPVTEAVQKDRTAVIVPLARFNPPHKEHLNLINSVIKKARDVGGTPIIFVSTTVDSNKNPLTVTEKIKYLTKMAGVRGLFKPASNMFDAIKSLNGKFDNVIFILGDDRVTEVKRIEAYNGKDYSFKSIKTISRHDVINTRSAGGDGVHASDIRRWAHEGDFENVRNAMPPTLSDVDVRAMMSLIAKKKT